MANSSILSQLWEGYRARAFPPNIDEQILDSYKRTFYSAIATIILTGNANSGNDRAFQQFFSDLIEEVDYLVDQNTGFQTEHVRVRKDERSA